MVFWFQKRTRSLPASLKASLEDYLSEYLCPPPAPPAPYAAVQPCGHEAFFGADCERMEMPEGAPVSRDGSLAGKRERFRPASSRRVSITLEEFLRTEDAGFSETLLRLIDQTGKKDSAIYTKANVSRQHFSKIRNNPGYRPTKATALAFAVALELDLEKTRDLIGRAGYALTRSSRFDLIVMYFLERGIYDLHLINEALYEFDQNLLGC